MSREFIVSTLELPDFPPNRTWKFPLIRLSRIQIKIIYILDDYFVFLITSLSISLSEGVKAPQRKAEWCALHNGIWLRFIATIWRVQKLIPPLTWQNFRSLVFLTWYIPLGVSHKLNTPYLDCYKTIYYSISRPGLLLEIVD